MLLLRSLVPTGTRKKLLRHTRRLASSLHTKQVQNLAQTGEGLKDGEIIEWFVKPGDVVNQYDMLCRVHSDKATIDVTSAYDGRIETLSSRVGDIVAVGDPLCIISTLKSSTSVDTNEKNIEIKGYRRAMFRAMQESTSIPHCHAFDVVALKEKLNTAQAVKSLSDAVSQVPIMHAKIDEKSESYKIPSGIHIGVAINTPHGLVVPCVFNTQDKSIDQIRQEIERLRELATSRCLSKSEIEGSTITLSNIGSLGILSGIGVIHPQQTSVVTIGKIVPGNGGEDSVHSMQISVSADHRIIDGYTLSSFMKAFSSSLKNNCSDDNGPIPLTHS